MRGGGKKGRHDMTRWGGGEEVHDGEGKWEGGLAFMSFMIAVGGGAQDRSENVKTKFLLGIQ